MISDDVRDIHLSMKTCKSMSSTQRQERQRKQKAVVFLGFILSCTKPNGEMKTRGTETMYKERSFSFSFGGLSDDQ